MKAVLPLFVFCVQIQSADNGYPLHVPFDDAGCHGFACVEMVRNIYLSVREHQRLGYASDETMRKIMGLIRGMYDLR